MLSYIPLRKKQIFINTWHGGGAYKCVDNISGKTNDAFECLQKIVAKQTSWFISSSVKFIEITSKGKGVPPEKFLKCGMPRNDIFFNDYSEIGRNIRSKYNILPNQSILLYAPTYRGKTNSAFFKNHLNFENCIQAMNKKFYTEVVIFLRAHHALLNNIDLFPITSTAINVSEYSDMQELLCTADFLITDYSSCMWDFSLTKKPGFLFVPDLEQYEKDRSFYTTINTWPYPFAKTNNELVSLIEDYDRKYAEEKINTHLNSLGSFERGNASDIVGETIFREIEI
jgi:CDP-glycerol glycerophosphotransferase